MIRTILVGVLLSLLFLLTFAAITACDQFSTAVTESYCDTYRVRYMAIQACRFDEKCLVSSTDLVAKLDYEKLCDKL